MWGDERAVLKAGLRVEKWVVVWAGKKAVPRVVLKVD